MKVQLRKLLGATLVAALLLGCAESALVIRNNTGLPITVTTTHTGQSIRIGNSKAKTLPHGLGKLTIKQEGGKTWQYSTLDINDYVDQLELSKKWVFIPVRKLNLSVNPDGIMTLVLPAQGGPIGVTSNLVITPK